MGCGWCAIDVADLDNASYDGRDIKAAMVGGSPACPQDILQEDVLSRRTGWRALRQSLSSGGAPVKPELHVRCQGISRAGRSFQNAVARLPAPLLMAHTALPLVVAYNEARLASAGGGAGFKSDPVVRVFPQMIEDPELLGMLARRWHAAGGQGIRDPRRRAAAFRKVVLALWPLMCTVERTGVGVLAGQAQMTPSARRQRRSSGLSFAAAPGNRRDRAREGGLLRARSWSNASASGANEPGQLNSGAEPSKLLFKPFNVAETFL